MEIEGKAGYHILYDKKAGDIMWFEFNDDNWVIASKLSHLVAGEEGLFSSSAASCGLPGLKIHAQTTSTTTLYSICGAWNWHA